MSVTILNLYKSWYIITAGVISFAVVLFLIGVLKVTRGLLISTGLIILYFLYLLLTAMWAQYPGTTIWYVATESIYIFIFVIFYLLSINFAPSQMIDFFVYLVPPAIIIYIITYIADPEAIRLGGYVNVFLPFILLFCTLRAIQSFSIRNVIYVSSCLIMLVIGMSRTPLLIAGLGLLLMFVSITERWRTRLRFVSLFIITGVLITVTILAVQPLRLYTAKTIVRVTYQDMLVGNQLIEAENPDFERWTVYADAVSLYKNNWLFGMGYMNFMPWYGDMHNFSFENIRGKEIVGKNLHNVFQTWALEGGLPCLCMVTLLLWKYFSILRRRISQSKNDLEQIYFKLLIIGMVCLLVQGLFHQIHQTPVFFILLGIVYGIHDKYSSYKGVTFSRDRSVIYVRHLRKTDI